MIVRLHCYSQYVGEETEFQREQVRVFKGWRTGHGMRQRRGCDEKENGVR